jgi:hypothetical protein
MSVTVTPDQIPAIIAEAKEAALNAADKFFNEKLGGQDRYPCGFAWVDIYDVKSNSKLGKALINAGMRKSYTRTIQMWNPSKFGCQNVDTLEAGAEAAAAIFQKYGFTAYAGSRLD